MLYCLYSLLLICCKINIPIFHKMPKITIQIYTIYKIHKVVVILSLDEIQIVELFSQIVRLPARPQPAYPAKTIAITSYLIVLVFFIRMLAIKYIKERIWMARSNEQRINGVCTCTLITINKGKIVVVIGKYN